MCVEGKCSCQGANMKLLKIELYSITWISWQDEEKGSLFVTQDLKKKDGSAAVGCF